MTCGPRSTSRDAEASRRIRGSGLGRVWRVPRGGFSSRVSPEVPPVARTNAWTIRKPLPLGPIHLVWQDAIVLGIVMLALHGTLFGRVWALGAFFLAYLGTLGVSFWLTGPWWMGYLVFFGLGLAVRLAVEPLLALGAVVPVYAIAMAGRDMALARFPWPESTIIEAMSRQLQANSTARRKAILGWPNQQLMAALPDHAVRRRDGILAPLLAAWWVYAVASNVPETNNDQAVFR